MARWPRGEAEIERLLSLKHLQAVTGVAANGRPLLDKAHRTLGTAASIASTDPDSAFVLAYDAARYAATALLTQQGLGFQRRRRNELEYPSAGSTTSDIDEATDAVAQSRSIIEAADQALLNLSFFS
jgi:hypothetical protein